MRRSSPSRRIVETSNGILLLQFYHALGKTTFQATAFDDEGWEDESRSHGYGEEGRSRTRDYHEKGGRDSPAEAIEVSAGISRDEAEKIPAETLQLWKDKRRSPRAMQWFVLSLVAIAFFVVGFFTLLIIREVLRR